MKLDFVQIIPSLPFIFEGVLVTLKYTILSLFFGFLLGGLLALLRISHASFLVAFARVYISVFRGTPLLVQLTFIYFAIPQLTGYKITAFQAGVLSFSLNSAAYVSEIIRAGILAVDRGQFEASASLGIGYCSMMKDIILPQAIRNILPALVNEAINLLKESALVSTIGEMDLLRRANIVAAEKYIHFEPLLVIAVIYYIMVMGLSYLSTILETRLRRYD
jgi:His/Glu/Gln/Arg/opine family amino acid ABC transporter permease subunit